MDLYARIRSKRKELKMSQDGIIRLLGNVSPSHTQQVMAMLY